MFTVAIDFDGVLNNLPEVWCKYLNDMYYTNQKSEQVDVPRNYNMSLNFPKLSHENISWPLHKDNFWEKVGYKDSGEKKLVDVLRFEFPFINVIIVTATDPEHWTSKYEHCFRRLFPGFPKKNIILTSRKDLIKCNILVDDNPEYLRASSAYKILMSAPYNIDNTVDVDSVCNNCEEVLNVILQQHLGKSYTYSK